MNSERMKLSAKITLSVPENMKEGYLNALNEEQKYRLQRKLRFAIGQAIHEAAFNQAVYEKEYGAE